MEPASYNVVAKQHTIVDYEGDAAKAKVQSMHDDLAAKEVRRAQPWTPAMHAFVMG